MSFSILPKNNPLTDNSVYYNWSYRVNKIIELINSNNKDIVCLQGIYLPTVGEDFADLLVEYDCITQSYDEYLNKKYEGNGNAIFWKRSVFTYGSYDTMLHGISIELIIKKNNEQIFLSNIKLIEGLRPHERLYQFKSCVKKMRNYPRASVIIVGDFSHNINHNPLICAEIISNDLSIVSNGKSVIYTDSTGTHISEHDFVAHNVVVNRIHAHPTASYDMFDDNNPSTHYPFIFDALIPI